MYAELDLVLELKLEVSEFEKCVKIEILAFPKYEELGSNRHLDKPS